MEPLVVRDSARVLPALLVLARCVPSISARSTDDVPVSHWAMSNVRILFRRDMLTEEFVGAADQGLDRT